MVVLDEADANAAVVEFLLMIGFEKEAPFVPEDARFDEDDSRQRGLAKIHASLAVLEHIE
jgi:hypothetical protein